MSEQDDRFDREVEHGSRIITNNNALSTSGVPEPEEWALIMVIFLLLTGAYFRKRNRVMA